MRNLWTLLVVSALLVGLAGASANGVPAGAPADSAQRYTPGVVWAKLAPDMAATADQAGEWDGHPILGRLGGGTEWVRLAVPEGREESVAAALRQTPGVITAEPEYFVHAAESPNDPNFAAQWGLDKIRAPLAWDVATGDFAIVIAILDTGVDMNHPDLAANLWQNFGEIAGNGVDDDGNGYVDDRWGWNAITKGARPQDDHGHGTHVAGIAGAVGNNGVGVAGILWRCRLMAIKVLNSSGSGTYAGVADGVYYAAKNGARVINMSLAGSDYSQLLQDAINDVAVRYDVVFLAAAGNCGSGGTGCGSVNPIMYPAAMENVISVAATDSGDVRGAFSEYNAFVDLAAPGVSIYSTALGSSYGYKSGTSMSSPLASGLAGLIRFLRPAWNREQVEAHMKATAAKVGNDPYVNGRNDYYGHGRMDAAAALWGLVAPPHLAASGTEWVIHAAPGEPVQASLRITNTGAGSMDWSVQVLSGTDWLKVEPARGTLAPNGQAVLNLAGAESLPPGLYRGRFRVLSTHPFWDGDAPQVDVYLLILRQTVRLLFPFVFL
ncbi:MAG: S8 family serine peptidase [Anaerolineae bacterium]|jgi:subtilisin family serine protease|nr:S8 family serine peptidase [Anaerolineae bacterium]